MVGVKRKSEETKTNTPKYRVLSIKEKVQVIKEFDGGKKQVELAKKFETSKTSIRRILTNRDAFLSQETEMAESSKGRVSRCRPEIIVRMERLLLIYIDDCLSSRIPLTQNAITIKARSLFDALKKLPEYADCTEDFKGSHG